MNIEDYENPFDAILAFEDALTQYTGAPYVVLTDCCTHAMELCVRLAVPEVLPRMSMPLPHRTYLSVPMMCKKLGMNVHYLEYEWEDEYPLSDICWDSSRLFKRDMYRPGEKQCLSFGHGKPLQIGTGGAILLDDADDYSKLKAMAYDGRHIHDHEYWPDQKTFGIGYHYMMRPEFAIKGMRMLDDGNIQDPPPFNYPDLREITIVL